MIGRLVREYIDLLIPPHRDVRIARTVTPERLFAQFAVRYAPEQRTYTGLSYSNELVRALIRGNKYYNDAPSAHLLSEVLEQLVGAVLEDISLDSAWRRPLLVPIPTAPKRVKERGVHQVKQIVRFLQNNENRSWTYADVLARENRESQTHVPKSNRARNIAGAFYVPKQEKVHVMGKHILVVDDITESGSTMKDAMRALHEAGARDIIGIALAK